MSNDIKPLRRFVKPLNDKAEGLVKKYFAGALTLVVEKSELTPDYITSGLNTVGIRVPDNKVFAEICSCIEGNVLATTSANLSNEPPALTYDEAVKYIGDKVDLVVEDYGEKAQGHASTVAGIFPDSIKIFRQGDIILEG